MSERAREECTLHRQRPEVGRGGLKGVGVGESAVTGWVGDRLVSGCEQ